MAKLSAKLRKSGRGTRPESRMKIIALRYHRPSAIFYGEAVDPSGHHYNWGLRGCKLIWVGREEPYTATHRLWVAVPKAPKGLYSAVEKAILATGTERSKRREVAA